MKHDSEEGKSKSKRWTVSTMWVSGMCNEGNWGNWKIRSFTPIDGDEFQFEGLRAVEQIQNKHQVMWLSGQQMRRLLSSNEDSTNATSVFHS